MSVDRSLPLQRLTAAVARTARLTDGRPRTGREHHDADDSIGTLATDSAHGFDPLPLLRALHRHGADVVVIGQVAGILHGSSELTGDLDLLWDGRDEQAARLAAAFVAEGAELTDADGGPVPCTASSFRLAKVLFRTPASSGDCCTPSLPWGAVDVRAVLARAGTAEGEDVTIRYAALDDLVRMRRAAGRPKDLRRADELDRLRPPVAP